MSNQLNRQWYLGALASQLQAQHNAHQQQGGLDYGLQRDFQNTIRYREDRWDLWDYGTGLISNFQYNQDSDNYEAFLISAPAYLRFLFSIYKGEELIKGTEGYNSIRTSVKRVKEFFGKYLQRVSRVNHEIREISNRFTNDINQINKLIEEGL